MATVGAVVYDRKTLLLSALPDGANNGKKGYARVSLSDGTLGSVTGIFSTTMPTSPSINVATGYAAVFITDNNQFKAAGVNSASTPVVGLLTYPAINWMLIIAILALVYYLYYHHK
jgi:hypothetical protein